MSTLKESEIYDIEWGITTMILNLAMTNADNKRYVEITCKIDLEEDTYCFENMKGIEDRTFCASNFKNIEFDVPGSLEILEFAEQHYPKWYQVRAEELEEEAIQDELGELDYIPQKARVEGYTSYPKFMVDMARIGVSEAIIIRMKNSQSREVPTIEDYDIDPTNTLKKLDLTLDEDNRLCTKSRELLVLGARCNYE